MRVQIRSSMILRMQIGCNDGKYQMGTDHDGPDWILIVQMGLIMLVCVGSIMRVKVRIGSIMGCRPRIIMVQMTLTVDQS